jgi:hypothetical protein
MRALSSRNCGRNTGFGAGAVARPGLATAEKQKDTAVEKKKEKEASRRMFMRIFLPTERFLTDAEIANFSSVETERSQKTTR